jgi:hypothetical protein
VTESAKEARRRRKRSEPMLPLGTPERVKRRSRISCKPREREAKKEERLTKERRVVKVELVDGSVGFGDAETRRRLRVELGSLLLVQTSRSP